MNMHARLPVETGLNGRGKRGTIQAESAKNWADYSRRKGIAKWSFT